MLPGLYCRYKQGCVISLISTLLSLPTAAYVLWQGTAPFFYKFPHSSIWPGLYQDNKPQLKSNSGEWPNKKMHSLLNLNTAERSVQCERVQFCTWYHFDSRFLIIAVWECWVGVGGWGAECRRHWMAEWVNSYAIWARTKTPISL